MTASTAATSSTDQTAQVVVVGSGIVGSSAAYHLARLGWTDILVIDKGDAVENDGSTSHAPGGVVALSHSQILTQMAMYGTRLYSSLEPFRPDRVTCHRVGTLEIAITEPRWADLLRLHGEAKSFGVETELLTPEGAIGKFPLLDPAALVGALFVADSQIVTPSHVAGALQRDAAATGRARIAGHTRVVDIEVEGGRVRAVHTDNPELARIECEHVLLCTNIWGPELGDRVGVAVPLLGFEHQYLITPPLAELAGFDPSNPDDEIVYPSSRELDSALYFRQTWDSLGVGSYWHTPRPVTVRELGRTAINPFTPEDFLGRPWDQLCRLVPVLTGLDPRRFPHAINGIFAFPVDGMPIIGDTEIAGLWLAVGSWLTHAGGVGKAIAEWMTGGESEWDLRHVYSRRFHGFQTTPAYVARVCVKNYREVYDLVHPRQPATEPRNVRLSPFAPAYQELKPVYTTFAGLELPNWFEANADLAEQFCDEIPPRRGWAADFWSPIQGGEHLATRRQVACFDLTGLSIIELAGRRAAELAEYLCSNRVAGKVSRVVYTTWLTRSGGVRRDLTVARMAPDRFWMFVGEGTRPQDLAWVGGVASAGGFEDVAIIDRSDAYTAIGLWGPRAREVLGRVSEADLSNEGFPYFTGRWIDVGYARVLALRLSYAGELGWELHIPTDFALPVWHHLWEAGLEAGMVAAGMGAFDSLRLEKGYRGWGSDVHTEFSVFEAGLGWTVKLDKDDFVGAEAVRRLAAQPLEKKLSCLTFDDRGAVVFGYEPILSGVDPVGYVTSANFGYSVGKSICYGYMPAALAERGARVEVEYCGERYPAVVDHDPLFDPSMARLRG